MTASADIGPRDEPTSALRTLSDRFLRRRDLAVLPFLLGAFLYGALTQPAFLTGTNLVNILQQSSVLALVVIAEALVLLVGKFDLSLESIVGFAPMLVLWLILPESGGGLGLPVPDWVGLVLLLLVGACVGWFNSLMVVKVRLNAFIFTLAMLILLRGVTIGLTDGSTLFGLPDSFAYLGSAKWLGVPVSVWLAGVAFLVVGAFLNFHRLGRAMYAIGGNQAAAKAAGINVERVTMGAFIAAGTISALAGLVLAGRLASVPAAMGQNMIFSVFAAAVIGGISLSGGRGTMFGALCGVLLLGVVSNLLALSQIPSFWVQAAYGGLIVAALLLARVTGHQEMD